MKTEKVAEATNKTDGIAPRRPMRRRSIRVEIGPLPVLCGVREYTERVGQHTIRDEETGKAITVPQYGNFLEYTPHSYTVRELKARLRRIVKQVVKHPKSFIQISLMRFEQVATVMGQLKSEFGDKFTWKWTSDEPENLLFEVRHAGA